MTDDNRRFIQRRVPSIPQSGLMTPEQTAAYLGWSRAKFYRKRKAGKAPPENKVVTNRWLVDEVEHWLGKAA